MKKCVLWFFIALVPFIKASATETAKVFTLQDLYGLVLSNHPVVQQAELLTAAADYEVMAARGLFDPRLKSAYDEKRYNGKDYWKIWQSSLRVPVWNAIDLKADFKQSTGSMLDPMLSEPSKGLSSFGVSIPLGQGLLIDARKAAVEQAKSVRLMQLAERRSLINKLLLTCNKDYVDWSLKYRQSSMMKESVRLADQRLEAIRYKVGLGELPAIDSVEALIELQNRTVAYLQSLNDFVNAGLELSTHLWSPEGDPVQLDSLLVPETFSNESEVDTFPALGELIAYADSAHPDLMKVEAKYSQAGIEKRWAAERLRPKIDLEYDFLDAGFFNDGIIPQGYSGLADNHRVGLNFSTSLFMREERGKYGIAQLKMERIRYESEILRREILTEIRSAYNELNMLKEQRVLQRSQLTNAGMLLEAETSRFNEGESSVFLVNSRENALVNSRIKLADLDAKFEKCKARIRWSAGALFRQ